MGAVSRDAQGLMCREDCYRHTLAEEFAPPDKAGAIIARLATRAEREAYWLRIPEGWRAAVAIHAQMAIGHLISELPTLDARRAALDEVPGIWRAEVEWHVRRLYNSRELRAMTDAEFARAYPDAWRREFA
jgi:hypothetical protein